MSAEKLKPCPFCGEQDIRTRPDEAQGTKWGIAFCYNCGSQGPEVRTDYDITDDAPWRAEAITEWNRRAVPDNVREAAERIIETCAFARNYTPHRNRPERDAYYLARHILGAKHD